MAEMERYRQLNAHDRVLNTVHTIALSCLHQFGNLAVRKSRNDVTIGAKFAMFIQSYKW